MLTNCDAIFRYKLFSPCICASFTAWKRLPLTSNYLICCFIPVVHCVIFCLINFTLFQVFWNQNPEVPHRTLRNRFFEIQWCSSLYYHLANSKCLSKRVGVFLHFLSWDLECWEFKVQSNYKCSVPYEKCEALHSIYSEQAPTSFSKCSSGLKSSSQKLTLTRRWEARSRDLAKSTKQRQQWITAKDWRS